MPRKTYTMFSRGNLYIMIQKSRADWKRGNKTRHLRRVEVGHIDIFRKIILNRSIIFHALFASMFILVYGCCQRVSHQFREWLLFAVHTRKENVNSLWLSLLDLCSACIWSIFCLSYYKSYNRPIYCVRSNCKVLVSMNHFGFIFQ